MIWAALLILMLAAFAALPTIGEDGEEGRSISQHAAGSLFAVAAALFVSAQVLA